MSVSSETYKHTFTGDGSTLTFNFTFAVFAEADVKVTKYTIADGSTETLTLDSDYSVSLTDSGASGGSVTLSITAPSSSYKIILTRDLDYTQETDWVENDPNRAEVLEDAVDKNCMLILQLKEEMDRSVLQDPAVSTQITFQTPTTAGYFYYNGSTYLWIDSTLGDINSLTDLATPAVTDEIAISDTSDSNTVKKSDIDTVLALYDSKTSTLTNKTFDANGTGNSLSNVEVADLASSAVVTETDAISSNDNDTTLPTSAAVKDYVDTQIVTEDTLDELNDTNISAPSAGDLIVYDATAGVWDSVTLATGEGVSATGGDGTLTVAADINGTTDLAAPAVGDEMLLADTSDSNNVRKSDIDTVLALYDAKTATLTNKTFDVDGTGNSLSNVSTSELKSTTGSDTNVATGTAGSSGNLAKWDANGDLIDAYAPTGTITFIIDGGGSAIETGIKGDIEIPFACTIERVTLLADQSTTSQIDIWKDTYGNFPPDNTDSITASAEPSLSTASKSQDSTLTGWTTSISADDTLRFNVDSNDNAERITVSLKYTRS